MDNALQQHSFLDSYIRAEYIAFEKTCSAFYPQNNLAYTKRSIELLNEAVKIQPNYTRFWLYLGTLTTTLANNEDDPATQKNLIMQADNYLQKALQLAPKHQEIYTAEAQLQIVAENYKSAENYSQKCISINPALGDCYWYLALSETYLKDSVAAEKDMQTAGNKGYNINSESSLDDLVNAYGKILDYRSLVPVLEKLVAINPNNTQYKSLLSEVNKKLGK